MSALATRDDLEARLGRDLTPEEETRVDALLTDASAMVRAYTGRDFGPPTKTTQVLRAQACEIRLPQRPVLSVGSVVAVGGMQSVPDLPIIDYLFDGIDLITLGANAFVINLPEAWWDEAGAYPGTYRVTWTHGFDTIPADVVMVVCGMVLRTLTAPTMQGGVTGETIGSYSYRLDRTAGGGLTVSMAGTDRQILGRYRQTAGTIMLRTR